jgi:hypothetical protein
VAPPGSAGHRAGAAARPETQECPWIAAPESAAPDAGFALPGFGLALSAIADVYGVAEASPEGALGPTALIAFTVK